MITWPEAIPISIGIAGLVFAGIKLIPPRRKLSDQKTEGSLKNCLVHQEVVNRLEEGTERMDQICIDVTVTRKAVLAIASHLQVPLGAIKDELKEMVR